MATTASQLIKWLQTLPQDAEIEVGDERSNGSERWMEMRPLHIESCTVISYTSPEDRVKYPLMAGRTLVMLCAY